MSPKETQCDELFDFVAVARDPERPIPCKSGIGGDMPEVIMLRPLYLEVYSVYSLTTRYWALWVSNRKEREAGSNQAAFASGLLSSFLSPATEVHRACGFERNAGVCVCVCGLFLIGC